MTSQRTLDRRRVTKLLAGLGGAVIVAGPGRSAEAAPVLLQAVPGTPPAPAFALPDLDGKVRTLAEFAGRVLVVNFWATWCPPCRAELPSMQRSLPRLADQGVALIGVHVGGDADSVWSFLAGIGVTFPMLIDGSGSVSRAWQAVGLPTTFVVDPVGGKALRAIGERNWDAPEVIAQIVAQKGASR